MSLGELEARLAEVIRQSEQVMTQTFRARGAKLERLTGQLETLDEETRQLEAEIARVKAGGAPSAAFSSAPPPAAVPAATSTPKTPHVAPAGYGR